jgi:arsenite-transporting ATPase
VFSFVGGKGGVGKTTCAAMAAAGRARAGDRVLLVTTDPAPSIAAALGVTVGPEPRAVRGARGLHAAAVDAGRAFERWLAPRKPILSAIAVRGTYLDDEDVARLLALTLPGIDEVIGLLEVVRLAGGFDAVVVDTAPTGHTLRLLASPALVERLAGLLDGLQAHHRAVVSALRGSYRADAADALIADLRREGESLAALLRGPETEISWVTLPEPMALEETADALAALAAGGMAVRRLIVNRRTPPAEGDEASGACVWCEARRRFESRALAPVRARFPGVAVVAYPEVAREPRGLGALASLAAREEAWQPAAAPAVARRARGHTQKGDSPLFSNIKGTTASPRWLLVGGKGGVGKSTCAAALSLRLAGTRRVLLLSTDPAHSLGDVFGQPFDNTPRAVTGVPSLHVREIDAGVEMARLRETYLDAVDEAFARIARAGGDRAAFRDLIDLAPPGVDEVIAVADVADTMAGGTGAYDVVVTDTAPTGHALRLLQTPAVLRDWTNALMALLLKYREITGAGSLAALLVRVSTRLRGLQATLGDPARASFLVVTRPDAMPIEESRMLIAALDRLGIAVEAVVVNAVGRGTCGRCRAIAAAQADEIARLRSGRGTYAIIEAPAEVPPPHGSAALRAWSGSWRQMTS